MSESMVERVARALYENGPNRTFRTYADYAAMPFTGEKFRRDHENLARAAIEAMREPTEDMLDAGGEAVGQWNGDMTPESEAVAQAAWPAMIDAALTPAG